MHKALSENASFAAALGISMKISGAVDCSLSALELCTAIVDGVSEALDSIPYVKSVAGIVLKIIKIRNELADNEEYRLELINTVARKSVPHLQGLKKIAKTLTEDQLLEMKTYMMAYLELLQNIHKGLTQSNDMGRIGRIGRIFNRGGFADTMRKYEKQLDEFDGIFKNNILIDIRIALAKPDKHPITPVEMIPRKRDEILATVTQVLDPLVSLFPHLSHSPLDGDAGVPAPPPFPLPCLPTPSNFFPLHCAPTPSNFFPLPCPPTPSNFFPHARPSSSTHNSFPTPFATGP